MGEQAEQEIYGCVEPQVHADEQNHGGGVGSGDHKEQENEGKVKPREVSAAEQSQEDEFSIQDAIDRIHITAGCSRELGHKTEKCLLDLKNHNVAINKSRLMFVIS